MSQTLHSFPKNALEEVRASLTEYKGKQYIDLRVFYKADNDEFRPSKKGLTLSPELLPELEEALQKLKEAVGDRMDIKDQFKGIPIDQVAEGLEKRWYIPDTNLQAHFDEKPQGDE